MARYQRFIFLCNGDERRIISALTEALKRSQSDSMRWLIREAARDRKTAPATSQPAGDARAEAMVTAEGARP